MIHHFLIGAAGSGKSTLAQFIALAIPQATIISTDAIRQILYGDAAIQGEWSEIETEVFRQIQEAIALKRTIIYDATNTKRHHRLNWLHRFKALPTPTPRLPCVAWWLETPVKICKARNQARPRLVPPEIIEEMAQQLKQFPPCAAEGFAGVLKVKPDDLCIENPQQACQWINAQLKRIETSRSRRATRTAKYEWHGYSDLLEFDRLFRLINLQLETPMAANLSEICAAMRKRWGEVYGEENAIARDLNWLETNGILGQTQVESAIAPSQPRSEIQEASHPYSDRDSFLRLMETLRFILHNPWQKEESCTVQTALINALHQNKEQNRLSSFFTLDNLQKDIERIFKPYKILDSKVYRRGYYLGTSIFTKVELNRVYQALQTFSHHSDNPEITSIFQLVEQRLKNSDLLQIESQYPLRVIGTKSIVDTDKLSTSSLARHLDKVEEAILSGELLELQRIKGSGRFEGDRALRFRAYPLQLVFHRIAWYLGFEEVGGEFDRLLRFERLDRLMLGLPQKQHRVLQQQIQAQKKLQHLYQASAGLFLGNNPKIQQQFLTGDRAATIILELWITAEKFRFINEGTQRFSYHSLEMSKPVDKSPTLLDSKLFCLDSSPDKDFPCRLKVQLPQWCLDDVELQTWVIGFAGHVKVVSPPQFSAKIAEMGRTIANLYPKE